MKILVKWVRRIVLGEEVYHLYDLEGQLCAQVFLTYSNHWKGAVNFRNLGPNWTHLNKNTKTAEESMKIVEEYFLSLGYVFGSERLQVLV